MTSKMILKVAELRVSLMRELSYNLPLSSYVTRCVFNGFLPGEFMLKCWPVCEVVPEGTTWKNSPKSSKAPKTLKSPKKWEKLPGKKGVWGITVKFVDLETLKECTHRLHEIWDSDTVKYSFIFGGYASYEDRLEIRFSGFYGENRKWLIKEVLNKL